MEPILNYKAEIGKMLEILLIYKKHIPKQYIIRFNNFIKYSEQIQDENLLKNMYIEVKGLLDGLIQRKIIKESDISNDHIIKPMR